jgi:hypothetical protein
MCPGQNADQNDFWVHDLPKVPEDSESKEEAERYLAHSDLRQDVFRNRPNDFESHVITLLSVRAARAGKPKYEMGCGISVLGCWTLAVALMNGIQVSKCPF